MTPSKHSRSGQRPALEPAEAVSAEATQTLIHDLQVHEIELELQNEELRRMQHQLEVSRERYFDLYDLAPVGYMTLSPSGIIREANLTAARLLGVVRGTLVQRPLTQFIQPIDQDVYYRLKKRLLASGEPQNADLRLVRSDASLCWARLEATVTTDPEGASSYRAVLSDITQHKLAEATLAASEARHRTLFESSHDALMTLAPPDWRFTSANSRTVATFGARDEADFLSRTLVEYCPPEQPDGSESAASATVMLETAMREGVHFFEWTCRRLSGEEFPATVLLTRLELDGQPLLQATVRDETQVKALQAGLSQQDRLSSMGMLAAGVAHEINNPLAYVLYNIETLAEELPRVTAAVGHCVKALRAAFGDDVLTELAGEDAGWLEASALESIVEHVQEALGGAQRIKTISRAISTFARVESKECSEAHLNYAIECAAALARNDIRFRAQLVLELGELPPLWASEGKLSQIILNLLINAAHAIDEGDAEHARIHVRTWTRGDEVFAEVADTGSGIAPATIKHIFEPFFTTKAVGMGSGLGLAICRSLVSEFGGDIRVESEVGRGTCFKLRFPSAKVRRGAVDVEPVSEARSVASARARILVVDDEVVIRRMMVRILSSKHDVVSAESGEAARVILEQDQAFDVILCDLMMPNTTGMDLYRWCASQYPALATQIVFVTGGACTPDAVQHLASIDNRTLEKPFEVPALHRLIGEVVAQGKRARSENETQREQRS